MLKFDYMELRSKSEAEQQFIDHIYSLVKYWGDLEGKTKIEDMGGLVHSILATLDGESGDMPPYELKPLISTPDGERWLSCGEDISGSLHEKYGKRWDGSDWVVE